VPDDVLYRAVRGEVDVVDDLAVAEPDQPVGSGGDLRVVRGEQDGHVVLGERQRGGVDQGAGDGWHGSGGTER
jgi:hypothetical protein